MKYLVVNRKTKEVEPDIIVSQDGRLRKGVTRTQRVVVKDDYKVLRYTGLTDLHGLEIIEGDIINKSGSSIEGSKDNFLYIEYQEPQWMVQNSLNGSYYIESQHENGDRSAFHGRAIEIIGNEYLSDRFKLLKHDNETS